MLFMGQTFLDYMNTDQFNSYTRHECTHMYIHTYIHTYVYCIYMLSSVGRSLVMDQSSIQRDVMNIEQTKLKNEIT